MTRLLLENAILLDPEASGPVPGRLLVENGRILGRPGPDEVPGGAELVDLAGQHLAPGFIDLHHHGRLVFSEPESYGSVLSATAASFLRHGTTGFLPTTLAWQKQELMTRVRALVRVMEPVNDAATPLGIHLEGPWIRAAARGAQPSAGIRPFSRPEAESLLDAAEGRVRMVTLAPEIQGAEELQALLSRRRVVAALGHSLADDACVMRAIDRGASHVTHLFNAMGPLHHRQPGLAGVALADDRLSCDLICDGVHVHPAMVRLAARAKGEGLVLITDRLDPGPLGPSGETASFGSGQVRDDGSALRLADGTLAGSNLTLDRALRNALEWGGLSLLEAVAACTLRPARLLGIESEHGTLRPGARADLVVLDEAGSVRQTWLAGRRVY